MTTSGSAADQASVDSTRASPVLMTMRPLFDTLVFLDGVFFFFAMMCSLEGLLEGHGRSLLENCYIITDPTIGLHRKPTMSSWFEKKRVPALRILVLKKKLLERDASRQASIPLKMVVMTVGRSESNVVHENVATVLDPLR